MNITSQRVLAWSGPALALGFGFGLLLAGYLPPPRADATPSQVAALYSHDTDRLRVAFVVMMIAGALMGTFGAAISTQLRRIEGRLGPMSLAQGAMGAANAVVVSIGAMIMIVAAFRPDRNPDVLAGLHDLAWFCFIIWFAPLLFQMLAIAMGFSANQTRPFIRAGLAT